MCLNPWMFLLQSVHRLVAVREVLPAVACTGLVAEMRSHLAGAKAGTQPQLLSARTLASVWWVQPPGTCAKWLREMSSVSGGKWF
jgi:hypothetical protein